MAPIVKRDYSAATVRKTLAFLNSLLNRPQDFLLENKKMTAELITEISYGMIRDDEDGGHEFVQMHLDVAKITATTVEGYWVDYRPWMKHIPPWIPFAQWKRDAIKWEKQYNFAGDYMFGAVKKQLVNSAVAWSDVSPIIAHLPIRDDKFQGYFIPKGTAVVGNAWQVSRDHRLYKNPTELNPERFLRRN